MNSEITKEFRQQLRRLPLDARRQAYAAYRLFKNDPYHPSLHFKRVDDNPPMYSVRVGMGYRGLGARKNADTIVWFWIRTHAEYDKILAQC